MKREKNLYGTISVLVICTALIISCEKEKLTNLTPDNLTECENCETHFKNSAHLDGRQVVDGEAIVFQYKNYWSADRTDGTPYSGLFFEIPSSRSFFNFDKNTITSEKVAHVTMCPYCNTVPLKPVDGTIRGERINENRWLVEAEVALAGPDGHLMDTVTFKHYFTRD